MGERILALRNIAMRGYRADWYIGYYSSHYGRDVFMIDDCETNFNNYRSVSEFSHWMRLPYPPKETSD